MVVNRSLIVVKVGKPSAVIKYDNLDNLSKLTSRELEPLTNVDEIWGFSLAAIKNRFLLLTGGYKK